MNKIINQLFFIFDLFKVGIFCLLMIFIGEFAHAQIPKFNKLSNSTESLNNFRCIPKSLGHYYADDWALVIDSTWGPGLPVEDKLEIFDIFWNTIDEKYAGFNNLDIDWDALRDTYRPIIANTVNPISRGRFSGIMSKLSLALMESHTYAFEVNVLNTPLEPGIPLLVVSGRRNVGHFGAGLTPLPDSSLLVYKTVLNHPLGLEPGDIILGYDGVPWKDLYKKLLEAELPITVCDMLSPYGSSKKSLTHSLLESAGLNWHLFDTIDIVKYSSGDTLYLSTSALIGQNMNLIATEQLPVPGVSMPDISNEDLTWVSWGIVHGTQIGYIYVSRWFSREGDAFLNAVNSMINSQTTGLILDFRFNAGGWNFNPNAGYNRLFNTTSSLLRFVERNNPNNRLSLSYYGTCEGQINGDSYLYNKPIAVLIGPGALSGGDNAAIRLKSHPVTRFFGKPTNTAYACMTLPFYPGGNWVANYSPDNAYLASNPGNYLVHVGFEVDEEVWLTSDGVAQGRDDVVEAAINWIESYTVGIDDKDISSNYILKQNFPNPFHNTTMIEYFVPEEANVNISIYNLMGQLVETLVNKNKNAGYHSVEWNANGLESGVYFYRIKAGDYVETKRCMIFK